MFLIGASGSGKTSFMKTVLGDLKPKQGTVTDADGKDIYSYSPKQLASYRRDIGVVFQDYKLLESKTVRENVAFAMEVCAYRDSQINVRVPEILSQVGLLAKSNSFPRELSGGEAQRVAIARALIHNPQTVIGDEPTGNLDPKSAREVLDILQDLQKSGKTVLVITHDDRMVNALKKRVIAFKDGRVAYDSPQGEYVL